MQVTYFNYPIWLWYDFKRFSVSGFGRDDFSQFINIEDFLCCIKKKKSILSSSFHVIKLFYTVKYNILRNDIAEYCIMLMNKTTCQFELHVYIIIMWRTRNDENIITSRSNDNMDRNKMEISLNEIKWNTMRILSRAILCN